MNSSISYENYPFSRVIFSYIILLVSKRFYEELIMFNLLLDIDYMIAAFVILVVLYIFSKNKYSNITKANTIFYRMVLCAIITCIFNILMNVAATYYDIFKSLGYMLFRFLFNCGNMSIAFLYYKYARMYQGERTSKIINFLDILAFLLSASYCFISFVNMFTGIIASIDEAGIHHGPLFMTNSIIPALLFILVLIIMLTNRQDYTKTQRRSIIMYFLVSFGFVGIELLTNNVAPLTMFGIAISLSIIQQSLVSPEYLKLEKSLADAQEARSEAEEANRAKSSFLARMSHEIRTPLNAVIGFNAIISKESTDANIINYANDAKMAGENLLSLINDILDLSKIESGKLTLIDDSYSLKKLIHEEYLLFSLKAEEKGLKLIFDIDANTPSSLYGDDIRLKQIITNILSNAIKYTAHGTITFRVILESIEAGLATVRFEISDTGMGIKDEDLGKLFDEFQRIEEHRNRKIEGTGLGVNICASLLAMMGSKLLVSSVYGEGSTFTFTLCQKITDETPMGKFNANENLRSSATEEIDLIEAPEANVLVVDDTLLNLRVIKGLLKKTKINIDTANSAKKALELTLLTKYDLIFMDHLMPEINGIEAMKLIESQENGLNIDTPMVALTANAIKGAYEEYKEYGFDDAIFKPVKLAELNDVLIKYIKH